MPRDRFIPPYKLRRQVSEQRSLRTGLMAGRVARAVADGQRQMLERLRSTGQL